MAGRKQKPWREDQAILRRLTEVERRHLAGEPNTSIATALGVAESTVRSDLKRAASLWREYTAADIETARARVVKELLDVKERSLRAAEFDERAERAVLTGGDLDGTPLSYDKDGRVQFRGNKAAALGQARQSVMDIAKVLGLVVDKAALTDAAGQTLDLAALMRLAQQRDEPREEGGAGGDTGTA